MHIFQVDITTLFSTQSSGIFDMPHFSLAIAAGVACLLGGSNAISAMITPHVYKDRRWLGWYNVPGSFHIAQQLSSLARSASFFSDFVNLSFGLDSNKGPKFRGVHSGSVIEDTGSVAELFMQYCAALEGTEILGRKTGSFGITIARLVRVLDPEEKLAKQNSASTIIPAIPIAVNIGACVACAIFEDWFALSSILSGILVNGISSVIFGSVGFMLTHPKSAQGTPPGNGILGSGDDMVVLIGEEDAVNSVTRGKISLRPFSHWDHVQLVRTCSILFFIQAIAQLFLIPQASLFGQIIFLVSLGIPALHQYWLSLAGRENVHRDVLLKSVFGDQKPDKFTFGTRTTAVVFMLLVLESSDPTLLNHLLPNDTKVWRQWKDTILDSLRQHKQLANKDTELNELTKEDETLLGKLQNDAVTAYTAYNDKFRPAEHPEKGQDTSTH